MSHRQEMTLLLSLFSLQDYILIFEIVYLSLDMHEDQAEVYLLDFTSGFFKREEFILQLLCHHHTTLRSLTARLFYSALIPELPAILSLYSVEKADICSSHLKIEMWKPVQLSKHIRLLHKVSGAIHMRLVDKVPALVGGLCSSLVEGRRPSMVPCCS